MAANLYDAAFATLGRIFGAGARRPITALTLAGGFASTVSWPVTHLLIERVGWRGTYLIYAALLALRRRAAACFRPAARARHERMPCRAARTAGAGAGACRRTARPSCWSPRLLPPTPLCRPACRRICWRFSRAGIDAGDRRVDRRAVRPGAGRRAADRICLWPQSASAVGRALCARRVCSCAFVMLALLGISTPQRPRLSRCCSAAPMA